MGGVSVVLQPRAQSTFTQQKLTKSDDDHTRRRRSSARDRVGGAQRMPEEESTLGVVEPESAPVPETVESNGSAEKSEADGAQKENSDRVEEEN